MLTACYFCGSVVDDPEAKCSCPRRRTRYFVPEVVGDPRLLKKIRGAMHISPKDKRLYYSCVACGKIYDITAEASQRRRLGHHGVIACSVCHDCHIHALAISSWDASTMRDVFGRVSCKKVLVNLPKEELGRMADTGEIWARMKRLSEEEEDE